MREEDLPDPEAFSQFHPFIKGVFSQWHPTRFTLGDETFVNAEQWMMVQKARLFADHGVASAIMATDDPAVQKRLGQTVSGFDDDVWRVHRVRIVHQGNLAKFSQNEGAGRQLKATAPAMLVEANPRDWNWGNGLALDDPGNHDPGAWKGRNLLGRVLTLVRDQV
ncbi:NADAR family protein [Brevundimonas poindexterae]|uniref:NADAR family protein n=1 Tax=Brevundimonas poindexterae TaxID=74325 RepID=UPI001CFF46B6|nr:NADAR family protein [Brevundimonas poindexterae]